MSERVTREGLAVAGELAAFIETEALPGTGVDAAAFWKGFASIVADLQPKNREFLRYPRRTCSRRSTPGTAPGANAPHDHEAYRAFLEEIGYLSARRRRFRDRDGEYRPRDRERAGPATRRADHQRALFAPMQANARWGSLYDALYGTDAMGSSPAAGVATSGAGAPASSPGRGSFSTRRSRSKASPTRTRGAIMCRGGALHVDDKPLEDPGKIRGLPGPPEGASEAVFLRNKRPAMSSLSSTGHRRSARATRRGLPISGSRLPSPRSWIAEDSVACVDAEDKVAAYRNWLRADEGRPLGKGFEKGGKSVTRSLLPRHRLHRAGWVRGGAEGPRAHAGAQTSVT